MEKRKTSWLKRSLLIPAALLGALAFGGCKSTSALEEPSFLRQYSKPAAAAKAEQKADAKTETAEPSEPGKNYPLKVYLSGKGTFAEDFARGGGSAKAVFSPSQKIRIPAYISGSYSESEQDDGETLATKSIRGGIGLGGYADLSADVIGYAEGAFITEGINYGQKKDLDLDVTRFFGVGKAGLIVRSLDLKVLLSAGYGKGDYLGKIGTADLEDLATRGFITVKSKMKLFGKGSISNFDAEDEESGSEDKNEIASKEEGVYGILGLGYDEQNFKDLVKGRTPSGEIGAELRGVVKGMPYFIRLLATARREEYLYPYAKDKKDAYFGAGLSVGLKVCPVLWLTADFGYDGEQYCYGGVGGALSFGVRSKKK